MPSNPLYVAAGDEHRRVSESEVPEDGCEYRTPYRRDFARLIHSAAFRRLQGKTQLFPPRELDFFRNRLTHSLEVAQIAKSIALRLNTQLEEQGVPHRIHPDIVETAALAHDLGHPPFGHNGELALCKVMKRAGGFEGNAQTLRILTRLEKRSILSTAPKSAKPHGIGVRGGDYRAGLNLTARTLAATLKYDRRIPDVIPEKNLEPGELIKGYYGDEEEIVTRIRKEVSGKEITAGKFKTIECQIMDIADDIAYSTYDLEDALKCGHITLLDLFIMTPKVLEELRKKANDAVRAEWKSEATPVTSNEVYMAMIEAFPALFRKANNPVTGALLTYRAAMATAASGHRRVRLNSKRVGRCVNSVELRINKRDPSLSNARLGISERVSVEVLKGRVWTLVTQSPRLKVAEARTEGVIRQMFRHIERSRGKLLPNDFQLIYERVRPSRRKRVICDFIAGMTDHYALEFLSRLTSSDSEQFFKPIL